MHVPKTTGNLTPDPVRKLCQVICFEIGRERRIDSNTDQAAALTKEPVRNYCYIFRSDH
jgi:hypothetical protein